MPESIIALIPARSGSKRIRNKNVRQFAGHPLLAYTVKTALDAGLFSRVIVSTENGKTAEIARYYGAEVPFLRPQEFAGDSSPDIEWLKFTLKKLAAAEKYRYFSILRPTSPFRTADMIRKAWNRIKEDPDADSVRAVEKCSQHPAKMWRVLGSRMEPVMKNPQNNIEWHSMPIQGLPEIYVQNSSLEIAKIRIPLETDSIAGKNIIPFFTDGFGGYDLNREKDWIYAEYLIKSGKATLPEMDRKPYKT